MIDNFEHKTNGFVEITIYKTHNVKEICCIYDFSHRKNLNIILMSFHLNFTVFDSAIKDFVTAYMYFKCWQQNPHFCRDSIICQKHPKNPNLLLKVKVYIFWYMKFKCCLSSCLFLEKFVNNMIRGFKQLSPFSIFYIMNTNMDITSS